MSNDRQKQQNKTAADVKRTGRKTARPWLDTNRLKYIWDKIKLQVAGMIVNKLDKTGNAYRALSIPFGQVDGTSTSTVFTAQVPEITELRNGVCVYLRNGVVTSASGFTLEVNDLGAYPVYGTLAAATRSTTVFNVNYTMLFVFNEDRVEGGCWDIFYGYNSDTNTIAYNIRRYQADNVMSTKLYRYQIVFSSRDKGLIPANSTSNNTGTSKTLTTSAFDPFDLIYYYATTTAVDADASPSASYMYTQHGTVNLRYAFNAGTTLTEKAPVYIQCVPQSDGQVKLSGNNCIVQALPTTADGYVYLYLGRAYSNYQISLDQYHPCYYYTNGAVRIWTNA